MKIIIDDSYKRRDENLFVPNDGYRYVRLKHWIEIKGAGADNVNPFPEMITPGHGLYPRDPSGRFYDYVSLPEHVQWFIWRHLDWSSQYRLPRGRIESFYQRPGNDRTFARTTPGSLTYVWADICEAHRAFTESGSPEGGFRDYVTGRNLYSKNMEFLLNPTGGALGRIKADRGGRWALEAIDILKPLPDPHNLPSHLYFWITQWGKLSGATRFPQVKTANAEHGLPPAGVSMPFMSLGGEMEIEKSSCVLLEPGTPYSPYMPIK